MAVSAKGFEGVGPIFRVDATVDTQAQVVRTPRSVIMKLTDFSRRGRFHKTPPSANDGP